MTQCTIQLPRQQQKEEQKQSLSYRIILTFLFQGKLTSYKHYALPFFPVENSDYQIVKSNIGKVSFHFQFFIDKIIKFEGLTMADFITHRGNKSDRILQNKDKQKQTDRLEGRETEAICNLQTRSTYYFAW